MLSSRLVKRSKITVDDKEVLVKNGLKIDKDHNVKDITAYTFK